MKQRCMTMGSTDGRRWAAACTAALGLALAACATAREPFVWADKYATAGAPTADYLIAPGDLVSVQVWDNEKLSTRARVRSDGRISMPLLGDVAVARKSPAQAAGDVERELKDRKFVVAPRVNLLVEEITPLTVSVLGAVSRAGAYSLAQAGGGVADAIAAAGGLTDFAHKDRIFVIRRTPEPVRIRFTFGALTSQTGRAAAFRVQSGDVVVVE